MKTVGYVVVSGPMNASNAMVVPWRVINGTVWWKRKVASVEEGVDCTVLYCIFVWCLFGYFDDGVVLYVAWSTGSFRLILKRVCCSLGGKTVMLCRLLLPVFVLWAERLLLKVLCCTKWVLPHMTNGPLEWLRKRDKNLSESQTVSDMVNKEEYRIRFCHGKVTRGRPAHACTVEFVWYVGRDKLWTGKMPMIEREN